MTRSNWLAILTAVAAQLVLGFLWYSLLFPRPWSATSLALAIVAAFLLAWGLAWILHRINAHGMKSGALIGLGAALLLTLPPVLVHEALLGMPPATVAIDGGKELVTGFLVGAILGGWPRRAPSGR